MRSYLISYVLYGIRWNIVFVAHTLNEALLQLPKNARKPLVKAIF